MTNSFDVFVVYSNMQWRPEVTTRTRFQELSVVGLDIEVVLVQEMIDRGYQTGGVILFRSTVQGEAALWVRPSIDQIFKHLGIPLTCGPAQDF